jgi:putative exosortase-associated protein (TIGR04073 family)
MTGSWRQWSALTLIVVSAALPATVLASPEPVWPKSYTDGVTRKLGRGIANILTAPMELVRKPSLTQHREGGVAGLTIGVAQGIKAMFMRGGAGFVETFTCAVPFPDSRFQPLVQPEFVYANGEWAPD